MAVSKRLRFEILRRDNHACRYCGGSAPDVRLTVDHVVPVALGGSDEPSNLATACVECNGGKSSVPASAPNVADVAADAVRWAAAMRRAAEIIHGDRDAREEVEKAVWDFWEDADHYGQKYSRWLPADWYLSIHRWLDAGLTKRDMLDACHITIYARNIKPTYGQAWKYFCGVCWRMVQERQKVAQQLLDAEEAQ